MSGTGKRKGGKVVGIVLGVVAVMAVVATLVYRDGNLHAEERAIVHALDAGFVEKQVTVSGNTVNFAEGPDNGPALLLVHGQGMEWEDYASVLPELSKHYHMFAVDCFGHGDSEHDPALYSCRANGDALIRGRLEPRHPRQAPRRICRGGRPGRLAHRPGQAVEAHRYNAHDEDNRDARGNYAALAHALTGAGKCEGERTGTMRYLPWHFLYFFPLPRGHGSFPPIFPVFPFSS